jgi:hypothetical protein
VGIGEKMLFQRGEEWLLGQNIGPCKFAELLKRFCGMFSINKNLFNYVFLAALVMG